MIDILLKQMLKQLLSLDIHKTNAQLFCEAFEIREYLKAFTQQSKDRTPTQFWKIRFVIQIH